MNPPDSEPGSPSFRAVQTREIYQGPIPHPELLRQFRDIDPSYPDRIMSMTEQAAASSMRTRERGQVLSFATAMGGFALAAVLAALGVDTAVVAAAIAGVAPAIVTAVANLRK